MVQTDGSNNRISITRSFKPGTCVICGWQGIIGIICRRRRCAGRYFYDLRYELVRTKGRTIVSQAQRELFINVRTWANSDGNTRECFQEVIFPWSIGPRGAGYRYDICVPKLKLIVEYDSAMHRKYNSFFHKTVKGYVGAVMRDQAKDRMAKKAGWTLMRVVEGAPEGGLYVRRFIEQQRSR